MLPNSHPHAQPDRRPRTRTRRLARGALLATLFSALLVPAFTSSAATNPWEPYTADSFYKSRVPTAPVDTTLTTAFRSFMKTNPDQKDFAYPRIAGLGSNKWGMPYAEGGASDPVWKLTGTTPNRRAAFLSTAGFHAPERLGQLLTGTSDSPFVVADRAGGFTVSASNASVVGPHLIKATSWSVTWHNSNGLDYRNPLSNDARNVMSRGRISDARVIQRDEVDAAVANGTGLGHVLQLYFVETKSSDGFVSPMVGAEGNKFGWGAEGLRLRIKPSVDLTTRGLSPAALAIARTLKQNGAYIGDNSGASTMLKAEQTTAAYNPWTGSGLTMDSLKGLTWDDFQVVEPGWQ